MPAVRLTYAATNPLIKSYRYHVECGSIRAGDRLGLIAQTWNYITWVAEAE